MHIATAPKVGYVVKRYPRYSETFIVNEILAHEAAGLSLEIFALRPCVDTHFQDVIAHVRAPVHYLTMPSKAADFWRQVGAASQAIPDLWSALATMREEDARVVGQALDLARHVRAQGITHLHAHFATSATAVARLAAQLTGIPYTFTAHAKDIFHESVVPEDLARKLHDAAATITVSDYNVDFLHTHYGNAASQVVRIYNGLDLTRFPFASPYARPRHIVAVGRLVEKKGFGDLVEACALLRNQGEAFTCDIIGGGDLEEALRHQIEAHDLGDRVRLLGPRPQAEVITHLREAAVFAAPCVVGTDGNRDGLPTVLLEAMALGTPCISTDVTGIPEVVHDGRTGLMVPQHAPEQLAEALRRLLTSPDLRVALATQAREQMERAFDVHCNAAALRTHFRAGHEEATEAAPVVPALAEVA